ncbi:hypothetical protein HZF05_06675 [Sphingomonas sp. CGMCC 1.13654]|uniref:Uncharacterized protein n=1 Tax=Sphingomonas chungangi TaxID=2683589 RepID=A0A838L5A4_9SPHN|nr:hypothetical protein [Sphingomonas chungangi]MBA2933782.1 hypothetical protein [Sphingomonas chungangi]
MTGPLQLEQVASADFGPPPSLSDNANHPPVADTWWQESALFTFADAEVGFGCWLRFGAHYNRGAANLYTWTTLGDDVLDRRMLIDQPLPPGDMTECAIGGASVATIEPLMRYALALDIEDCVLRLEWRNFRHPLTMSFNAGGATLAKGHYNAMGEATGTLRWKGREIAIRAGGFSDHSWGVRRQHLPASRSFFCVFGDDFYAMAIPISTGSTRAVVGYVFADGKLGRLESESALGYHFREDWVSPAGCDARLVDEHGRVFAITGETFGPSSTWPMGHGKFVTHAPARFQCDGRDGQGILESAQFAAIPPAAISLGLPHDSWWLSNIGD